MPDKPFNMNPDDPVFYAKLKKLHDGLHTNNIDKIKEIKEYFQAYGIQLSYKKQSGTIRMIAFDPISKKGSVPIDLELSKFI